MTDVVRTITVANYEIDVYELESNSDFFKIYYYNVDNECENNTLVLDKIYYDRSDLIAIKVLHEIGIFYTTYHKPVKSK